MVSAADNNLHHFILRHALLADQVSRPVEHVKVAVHCRVAVTEPDRSSNVFPGRPIAHSSARRDGSACGSRADRSTCNEPNDAGASETRRARTLQILTPEVRPHRVGELELRCTSAPTGHPSTAARRPFTSADSDRKCAGFPWPRSDGPCEVLTAAAAPREWRTRRRTRWRLAPSNQSPAARSCVRGSSRTRSVQCLGRRSGGRRSRGVPSRSCGCRASRTAPPPGGRTRRAASVRNDTSPAGRCQLSEEKA